MTRIAYVNGRYVRHADASVHVEDRGYQFADGVYEVCEVRHGLIIDLTRHLDRLGRSLSELRIDWPMHRAALVRVIREVVKRNRVRNGLFYLQVTRGVAKRDHVFPAADTRPSIVVTAKNTDPAIIAAKNANGIRAITVPDNRWDRVDIKTAPRRRSMSMPRGSSRKVPPPMSGWSTTTARCSRGRPSTAFSGALPAPP
jgi:D-alanine transaminase